MEIAIGDLEKVDLRIGRVLEAVRVEGSDKLLRLTVDLGTEQRIIVAGIGRAYEPSTLLSRQILVVANLAPRTLMGIESQGMVLAASDDNPVILAPEREVPSGSSVR
jgi:methionine--tRNA ligase beta chain